MKRKLLIILIVMLVLTMILPTMAFADSKSSRIGNIVNGQHQIILNGYARYVPVGTQVGLGYNDANTGHIYARIAQMSLNYVRNNFNGLYYNILAEDGIYGNGSYSAASAFQQWWNDNRAWYDNSIISVDGVCGDQSWARFSVLCA